MKFDKYFPNDRLQGLIKYFIVSESVIESEYKVIPSTGLVIGFQYRGSLLNISSSDEVKLSSAGITGMTDGYRVFRNSADIGTVLVYFTETGFTHFASQPANELFNLSLSLNEIFNKNSISEVEEKLSIAQSDRERVDLVENFLISQHKEIQTDKLILEAVRMIYLTKGSIRIKELSEQLFTSQSPFEKRFRKVVGTTPKKFASIVRFNTVLQGLNKIKSLSEICYENGFFDQAHFIKDFRQFTGDTPENFKRFL